MLKIGTKIKFNKDLIEPAKDGLLEVVSARAGEDGKIIGTERPGNPELFWVESPHRRAFLVHMNDFEAPAAVS
jgi:hypothetical protein